MDSVILDVDSALGIRGGDIDDAHAIAFMVCHTDLFPMAGITVTAGNVTRSSALRSTDMVVKALRRNVEIAVGRDRPLKKPLRTGHSLVLGGSQDEEWILSDPAREKSEAAVRNIAASSGATASPADSARDRRDAIEFLAAELEAGPRIVVPIAPLTTIATFLQTHHTLANRISRMVTMGGWFRGEARGSEFNVDTDPTAAAIVYGSGIPMVIAPLEMTTRVRLYPSDIVEWERLGWAGRVFYDGTMDWLDQMNRMFGEASCHLHDPLAAAYLCYPELFETMGIVPAVEEATGRTSIAAADDSSPVRLITDYDVEGFKVRFLETMRRVLC